MNSEWWRLADDKDDLLWLLAPCIFVVALVVFHASEYVITKRFSPQALGCSSFLCSRGYAAVMAAAVVEYAVEFWLHPPLKLTWSPILLGVLLIVAGGALRIAGRVTAGRNFTHRIATHRGNNTLVTSGVYSVCRHPGYTGFFAWAIGTQVLLANPLSLLLFAVTLRLFFRRRIVHEERLLEKFFGAAYRAYRRRTTTCMPCLCLPSQDDEDADDDVDADLDGDDVDDDGDLSRLVDGILDDFDGVGGGGGNRVAPDV
jgi:protein-S-isoprenylcysteine O-methyltransferase